MVLLSFFSVGISFSFFMVGSSGKVLRVAFVTMFWVE